MLFLAINSIDIQKRASSSHNHLGLTAMRLNPKFILVISIICGLVAFYLTLQALRNAQKEKPVIRAVTAINDLDIGTVIRVQDVKLFLAPEGTDPGTIFQDPKAVAGKTLRNTIRRGDIIKIFDIVKDGDNLSSIIPPGYRALTINPPLASETLQFLKFGSRVDVVFTANNPLQANTVETKTIMKNILVLKVAQAQANAPQGMVPVTLSIKIGRAHV